MQLRLVPNLEEQQIAHEEHLGSGNKERQDIRVYDRILLLVLEKLDARTRNDRITVIMIRWLREQV